ncbi:MAG: imelysin family protein [Dongiaceae bacterium]
MQHPASGTAGHRRARRSAGLLLVVALLPFLVPTGAPAAPPDLQPIALKVAQEFVLPRYMELATDAAAERDAWDRFCRQGADIAALDHAYYETADAWSAIEILHYGPIGIGVRHERMAHWPERKNAVDKALTALLAHDDLAGMTPEAFAQTSVAGQGLSALERLLFDPENRQALTTGPEAAKRCAAGKLIATSLATIAGEVSLEWSASDGPVASLGAGDPARAKLMVTRIATDLLSIYQLVGDMKLDAIMGESAELARPALAEGRRSARSSRALQLDLEAARELTRILIGTSPDAAPILAALDEGIVLTDALPSDFGPLALEPAGRAELALIRQQVREARDLSNATVPAVLGVTLGFNSLDGD